MKTVKKNDLKENDILINLDTSYIPYQKLIYYPEKYLDKSKEYFFICKNGIKSREVVKRLELLGYNVTKVLK